MHCEIPASFTPMTAFDAIETILPHRGTMLLLDSVSACDETTLRAHASVDGSAWYADAAGAMPVWIGIELMAQAIAAHVALLAQRAGAAVRPGVLLGSRRYHAHQPAFACGSALVIEVSELLRSEAGHGAYECAISSAGVCGAQAVVKVFQPDDFHAFIGRSIR
ncbi:beta-hydroxyacyl-ACP dehydratase [Paraburkholderia bonniea]